VSVPHPFGSRMLDTDHPGPRPDAAAKLSRPVVCSCARSPWCQGPASADWADCDRACRACLLPPPSTRRPRRPVIC
jgi:hypothetical protein